MGKTIFHHYLEKIHLGGGGNDFFQKIVNFQENRILRVLKIFTWFFEQNEAEDPYFTNQKFFTTLTSFLPPFFEHTCLNKIKFLTSGFLPKTFSKNILSCLIWTSRTEEKCERKSLPTPENQRPSGRKRVNLT